MEVKLLTSKTSLQEMENIATQAGLICHNNEGKQVDNKDFLTHIIKNKHESVLEHINLTYSIRGLSRACLQELARHRHISLSVESTRHTLRTQVENEEYVEALADKLMPCERDLLYYFVRLAKISDYSNDELKYYLPEFWPTNLVLTSNVRELRHILKLRTSPESLKEFQVLAHAMADALPEEFRYLVEDCVRHERQTSYAGL